MQDSRGGPLPLGDAALRLYEHLLPSRVHRHALVRHVVHEVEDVG